MNALKVLFCCAALTIAGCALEEETKGWAPIALVGAESDDTHELEAGGEAAIEWECSMEDGYQTCCDGDWCCIHDEGAWHCG